MRVLIVGSGGREHALAWKLAAEPDVRRVYCAPGNVGIAAVATRLAVDAGDPQALLDAAVREHDRSHRGRPRAPAGSRYRRSLHRSRPADLRTVPRRRAARVQQGVREGIHGPPRHPDGAISRVRDDRGRAGGAGAGRAGPADRGEGRRPRRRQGGRGRHRSRDRRAGDYRRHGGSPVRRRRRTGGAGRVPGRTGSVVLRALRRQARGSAALGAGSQARLRSGSGAQHRRDGRLLAQPAARRGPAGDGAARDHRAGAAWSCRGRGRVPRLSVRRPDADLRRPEGDRVQRAVRRPRSPGGDPGDRRAAGPAPGRCGRWTAPRRRDRVQPRRAGWRGPGVRRVSWAGHHRLDDRGAGRRRRQSPA